MMIHYNDMVIFPAGFQDTHVINTRKARNIECIYTFTYIINLFHAMFYMNFRIIDTPWVIYPLCVIDVQKINHRCRPTLKSQNLLWFTFHCFLRLGYMSMSSLSKINLPLKVIRHFIECNISNFICHNITIKITTNIWFDI